MTDFWRRLYAALTHTGPGYEPAATREAEIRATLADLAERWEQMAKASPDFGDELLIDEPTPLQLQQRERAHTYKTAAADLRDVLRTGRIPHPLMTDAELEQYGTPEETAR